MSAAGARRWFLVVGNYLGFYAVFVPMIGALVIAAMARYGSERIRGHGIPETIEAILISGRRVEPKVALLKPGGERRDANAGFVERQTRRLLGLISLDDLLSARHAHLEEK